MFTIIGFFIWMYLMNYKDTGDDNVFFFCMVGGIACMIIGMILDSAIATAISTVFSLTVSLIWKLFSILVITIIILLIIMIVKNLKQKKEAESKE